MLLLHSMLHTIALYVLIFRDILSVLLVWPDIFVNITSDVFLRNASWEKSAYTVAWLHNHATVYHSTIDILTCSIHGIQQTLLSKDG